jgi:RNA polymerase sigma-70 factor (ECF subfamily)
LGLPDGPEFTLNSRGRYFHAIHQTASLDRLVEVEVIPPAVATTPDAVLQQKKTLVQVRRAIAKLGERQREILERREFEQLDYQEIGDRPGVPVGTVRSRRSWARAELRSHLLDADCN